MQKQPFQVVVNVNQLKKEIERVLIECSNAVFIGLAAIEKLQEAPEYLIGEDDFLIHSPFLIQMNLEDSKKYFKSWVIKKGLEDLIKGITLMMIEVCKVIKKQNKLAMAQPESFEELKEILDSPEHEVSREHLPRLIEMIKPYLTGCLKYLDEINSINRVRRCLVHRDALVSTIDIQGSENNVKLSWVYFEMIYEEDGVQKPFVYPTLMTSRGKIILKEEKREKAFAVNERIEIGYQLFNELIWTAFQFGEDLIHKLIFVRNDNESSKP